MKPPVGVHIKRSEGEEFRVITSFILETNSAKKMPVKIFRGKFELK